MVQVAEKYRVVKATNTLDFRMGELFTKAEVQKVISSGVTVTISQNK